MKPVPHQLKEGFFSAFQIFVLNYLYEVLKDIII